MPATMIVANDTKELNITNKSKQASKKLSAIFLFMMTRYVILVIQNLAEGFLKTMKMCGMSHQSPILGSF